MSDVVQTLIVELHGGVAAYIADMRSAESATLGVSDAAEKASGSTASAGKSFGESAKQAGVAGAAILGVGAAATAGALSLVQNAATFETSMRQVAVATNEPASAIKDLSGLAKKLGQDTVFSAQDAGDAMLELAKGGMSAAQIKSGALSSTLTLASAGGLELGNAASYMVSGLSLFNLTADKSGAVAAALAGAANASQASVEDMGMALAQVGPGAATAGLSLQETTGVLAAFAANGILGSDAGTSLKTMLTRLVPTTEVAAKEMRRLGLDFTDAKGAFLPIGQVAQQLQNRLGKLSEEQRSQALSTLFGSDATRAATILMDEGSRGIGEYVKATSDLEQAERLAAAATEGTAGALEAAKGSIDTAKLAIGEALAPAFVKAADGAAALANKVGPLVEWMQEHEGVTQALAGALGGALVAALGAVTAGTIAWTVAMLANPIGIVVVALAALGAGLVYAWNNSNTFSEVFLRMSQGAVEAARFMVRMVLDSFDLMISGAAKLFGWLPGGVGEKLQAANREFDEFAAEVDKTMGGMADKLGRQAELAGKKTGQQLIDGANKGIASKALSLSEGAASVIANAGSTREAAERGEQLGGAIALGMAAGIREKTAVAISAAARMAGAVISGTNARLLISSPSRVFREMGGHVAAGFADGISAGAAAAATAARDMAAAADLAARATVDDTSLGQAQNRALTTPIGAAGAALIGSQGQLAAAVAAQAKLDAATLGATARSEGLATAARAADERLKALTSSTRRSTTAARQHALDLRRAADAAMQHARALPAGTDAQQAARAAAMRHAQALAYQARESERTATATGRASSAQIAQARAAAAAARAALNEARARTKDAVDAQRQGAEEIGRLTTAVADAQVQLADAVYAAQVDRARGLVEQASADMDSLVEKANSLRSAFASGITQGTAVTDLFGEAGGWNGMVGAVDLIRGKIASARDFAAQLTELSHAGLSDTLITELAALGPAAGSALAESIGAAGPVAIAELSALTDELAALASSGMDPVADALYGAGATATAQLAAGIAAGFPELDATIATLSAKLATVSMLRGATSSRSLIAPTAAPSSSGPVSITVPVVLDGREIARATAPYDLTALRRVEAIAPGRVGVTR